MGNVLPVDPNNPAAEAVQAGAACLKSGGVVIMPTDSVYGIGAAAIAQNPGHEQIFALKKRDRAQTLPLVVADPSDLDVFGKDVPAWAKELAQRYWPGALTLVVNASSAVPEGYAAADNTVAIRVPDCNLVRELCREVGAIALTSANSHGAATPAAFSQLEPALIASANLTYDGGACPVGQASTIILATGAGSVILRQGSIIL